MGSRSEGLGLWGLRFRVKAKAHCLASSEQAVNQPPHHLSNTGGDESVVFGFWGCRMVVIKGLSFGYGVFCRALPRDCSRNSAWQSVEASKGRFMSNCGELKRTCAEKSLKCFSPFSLSLSLCTCAST